MIDTTTNGETPVLKKTSVLSKRKQRKQDELAKVLQAQEKKETWLKSQQILEYIEKNKDDVEWVKILGYKDLDEIIIKFKNWEVVRCSSNRGSESIKYIYKPEREDGYIEIDKYKNEFFEKVEETIRSLYSPDLECENDEWAKYTKFIPELYK